ncbi:hypothetical protein BU23DRAFT_445121 [Bimuria novae-zelandiae CBS 107.79]|uniref:PCI domain-containing protein n=1 Tax=Bimuria novae-zelandiae CBS 107.79 TaxID=1447943 RepID=A0A6A5VWM6_9PLEO|nr:hypothetical protein BU23DRAFT_445121 [Bimuria novae-zelandiae CBS 107.79]
MHRSRFDTPSQAASAPPAKPAKVEWPPPVREYVGRAFEVGNAIAGISKDDITMKLREIISFFAERSQLESLDWPTYPLPQEIIRDERAAAKALAQQNTLFSPHSGLGNAAVDTPQSKKRKSQDKTELSGSADASIPPWRRTNLESRITFTNGPNEKRHKKNALSGDLSSKFDQADLEKRKQRFQLGKNGNNTTPPWSSPKPDPDADMDTAPCVGTNMSLEKSYFRLTAPPKPETVRPQPVLEKTLAMLRKKWRTDKNYGYMCNQFKSLRQDLTVQHIKNDFTVKVYETHARIALEQGDMGEYNQCQTQLKALYAQNLPGKPDEFTAYRILYFVYTCNKTDMNDLLAELTPADKTKPEIKHALDVRSSLAVGNYHKFFRLYSVAPHMGGYLMDMFIERERLHALANISRAFITVALRYVTDELQFGSDDECREFLESHGASYAIEKKVDEHDAVQLRVKVKEAASTFESLRQAAFARVDIKGQI